jgi:crotonobetainyl-CoA:carnitine CoA-transferase CaiB-like acyl-CoA transferase
MTDLIGRKTGYLDGWRFLILSDGAVGTTAASVLSAMGATVDLRADEVEIPAVGPQSYDAVICDRIVRGADSRYLDQVATWLNDPAAGLSGSGRSAGVWVTASAFGLDGPMREFRGSNLVMTGAAGLVAAVTDSDGIVHEMPGQQGLKIVGQLAALAALHGVSLSRDSGARVHQDLSGQEGVAFLSIQQDLAHVMYRCGGRGGAARYSAPAGIFTCTDGAVNVLVIDDHQFGRVAKVVGHPEWITDYQGIAARVEHGDEIDEVMRAWAAARTKTQCERLLQDAGVSATAVRSIDEVAASEQFVARGWFSSDRPQGVVDVLPALVEAQDEGNPVPDNAEDRRIRDLRVVEVTNVLAGPLTGAILGDMGADVVRLEDVGRLDVYRRNGPFADGVVDIERAAYFLGANNNKRSVSEGVGPDNIDFSRSALDWANVMIENVGVSRLARVGADGYPLGHGTGGIALSISGFGRSGPCADFRGYAPNVHAFSGLEDSITKSAGSRIGLRTALADYCTALWAATFAVAWWLGGYTDQERVDLSMSEVVALKLMDVDSSAGRAARNVGNEFIVPAANGKFLAVSFTSAEDQARVRQALGATATDDMAMILSESASGDAEGTVRLIQQAGVAAYLVRTVDDVHADVQLRARKFFYGVEHPIVADAEITTLPWKIAGAPRSGYTAAPTLGAHDEWARQTFGQSVH